MFILRLTMKVVCLLPITNQFGEDTFQPYFQTTFLEEETDPNKLYDLQSELEQFGIYTTEEVKEFALIFFNPEEKAEKLQPILDNVVNAWRYLADETRREDFRTLLQRFIRLYGFVSQLISFEDVALEELYVFAKNLNRKLPKREKRLPTEIREAVDLDSFRIQKTFNGGLPLTETDSEIPGIANGRPQHAEEEKDLLSHIIDTLNETYGLNLTEDDKVDIEQIKIKLEENEELRAVMNANNTLENIRYKFDKVVDSELRGFVNNKIDLYKKLTDPAVNATFKQKWFDGYVSQSI